MGELDNFVGGVEEIERVGFVLVCENRDRYVFKP